MNKRVAMITVHECPLASSEGKERGGINVYTFELSKALAKHGWHVDAFTRIQDDINPRVVEVDERFRVIHLPNGPHAPLSKKDVLSNLPEFTKHLVKFAKKEHTTYDLMHAHYYFSGLVAHDFLALSGTHIPIILTFHTLGLMKQLVARSKDTEDPPERITLERELATVGDRFITSSETGKEYLAAFYDVPKQKIVTIPPGVDTSLFRPIDRIAAKRHIGADSKEHLILAVGRIDPVKGFDVLLVALKVLFKRNPALANRVCLLVVGGDLEQSRQQWSRELKKLDALRNTLNLTTTVRFVAPLPQEELPYYYNAANVLVMPSHYESFGMVALEAIACGTPVIATDVTGISPILKDMPQGHIVSANNPLAVAGEIEHVLAVSHRETLPNRAITAFDWSAIAGRISGEYEKLLKRR